MFELLALTTQIARPRPRTAHLPSFPKHGNLEHSSSTLANLGSKAASQDRHCQQPPQRLCSTNLARTRCPSLEVGTPNSWGKNMYVLEGLPALQSALSAELSRRLPRAEPLRHASVSVLLHVQSTAKPLFEIAQGPVFAPLVSGSFLVSNSPACFC